MQKAPIFSEQDFQDLLQLLAKRPDLREQFREVLFKDDLLALPGIVRDLGEAQKRTEQHLDVLAQRMEELTARINELASRIEQLATQVDKLAARVDDLTVRLEQLTARVDDLTVRLEQLTARIDDLTVRLEQLTARVDQLTARVDDLTIQVRHLADRVGYMSGRMLEMDYRAKPAQFFGRLLRKARLVEFYEIEELLEAHLSEEEMDELRLIDLIVRGQLKREDRREAWLAVEVSSVVDRYDVERARRRADLMRQAGLLAIPVAASERLTEGAYQAAEKEGVVLHQNGTSLLADNALARLAA